MKIISACEVCGNESLRPLLDLGEHPMCDDLVAVGEGRKCKEYPIRIVYCDGCKTAHQGFNISAEELFPQSYHYRSRHTVDVLSGMRKLVQKYISNYGGLTGKTVLDIGCNDGSLLNFFRDQGAVTHGIEPTGAYADAERQGHLVFHNYFDEVAAKEYVVKYGHPNVITFTNVFAHIVDFNKLISSLRIVKGESTIIVIENHYLGAVLSGNQFDTFYHEHPRTYSFNSFLKVADLLRCSINDVQFPARYGGNIQVFLGPRNWNKMVGDKIDEILKYEDNFVNEFERLSAFIDNWKIIKYAEISNAVRDFGPLQAKAFPGRAAILVKILGLDSRSISGVYEKPDSNKVGHLVPGTDIPIFSDDLFFRDNRPGAPVINFAWHIQAEVEKYMRDKGYFGKFINIM